MQQANWIGMILFRENAVLPDFTKDSELFMPGWRIIKNLDGYALQQKMKGSNWSIRHVVGEKKARVMGRTTQETLLRGIKLILTELRGRRFNALEVTVVTVRRFLGVTYLSISANLKHFESA